MKHTIVYRSITRGLLAFALVLATWGVSVSLARMGSTFTVTKEADTADGACNADCSLREAVIAANAHAGQDTISIPQGFYTLDRSGSNEDVADTGDLDITDNLIISGADETKTTISGASLDRVFDIRSGAQVQMSNLTLRDGRLSTNLEVDGSGGGIRIVAGSAWLSHMTLTNNYAMLYGGAIMNGFRMPFSGGSPVGLLHLDHVNIHDNMALSAGGGVFLGEGAPMEMDTSAINSNLNAGTNVVPGGNREGGAGLFVMGSAYSDGQMVPSVVTINHSTFTSNLSTSDNTATGGGAIFMTSSDTRVDIQNSTFTDNRTRAGNGGFAGSGGAINNDGAMLTVTNSLFNLNDSLVSGGALMIYAGHTTINSSSFTNNISQGGNPFTGDCGGAIKARSGAYVAIDNTIVATNTSALSGGGICFNTIEAVLNRMQIFNNEAQNNGVGGGLYNANRLGSAAEIGVQVMNSSIHDNRATDGRGGGIANVSSGVMLVSNSTVYSNSAANGGGIDHYIGFALWVTNTQVLSNTADQTGGGLALRNDTGCSNNICPLVPQLTDVTVQGNRVISDGNDTGGGGIYNMVSARLNRVTISNNEAQQGGGILSFHNATGDFVDGLEATNLTVSGNTAHDAGGGVYIALGVAKLNNVTIANNNAITDGGGLYSDLNNLPTVQIKNSIVANNGASNGADCGGTIVSGDYNLIRDPFGCTVNGTAVNNITNQDPTLGALANNGGSTWTLALQVGSPAINHGNPAGGSCAATDQRQAARVGVCDMGAYEFGSNAPTPTATATATQPPTLTATATQPGQITNTPTPTRTPSRTPSVTTSVTTTPTQTKTPTPTVTVRPTDVGGKALVYLPMLQR